MDGLNRILSTMYPADCDAEPSFRLGLDPGLSVNHENWQSSTERRLEPTRGQVRSIHRVVVPGIGARRTYLQHSSGQFDPPTRLPGAAVAKPGVVVAGTADLGRNPTHDGGDTGGAEQDYRHACHPHRQVRGAIDLRFHVDLLYA
jgi:hypothetical protein